MISNFLLFVAAYVYTWYLIFRDFDIAVYSSSAASSKAQHRPQPRELGPIATVIACNVVVACDGSDRPSWVRKSSKIDQRTALMLRVFRRGKCFIVYMYVLCRKYWLSKKTNVSSRTHGSGRGSSCNTTPGAAAAYTSIYNNGGVQQQQLQQ